ncbi:penicillin-binding transpeptidase domain-containing protein [Caproiciproducens sp.]|uniref:penicillin-binding transpeptidase domain-containing protein n=1 Tax=Caproiciproducens sp. TaxID=1954376 RepID=UPI00289A4C9E|nr:penicillin-binding transpeptidase domain-containing protein [Caproiciproducens sp.]
MKTTGARSLILYILGLSFLFGLGVFLYGIATEGGSWAMQPFNKHLTSGSQLSGSGKILDRNNVVLAKSENGKRVYNSDETVRRAMLHTVGDSQGYISTGIQYNYRSELSGYNIVTGLASPTGKSGGSDIKLTLDSSLCKLALQKLGSSSGAVAIYNYKTGEMLCSVSSPNFDPSNPPKDLDTDKTGKYNGVYLDRVLSSSYTPGSIFKLVTSVAAIENISDLDSRTWDCKGSITINGNKITDVASYGTLSFKNALAKSSNVAFAQIAIELGADKMTAAANSLGFNRSFDLDGITTSKSVYKVDGAQPNELGWSGVGQYTDLTNPFHMMLMEGAIANDGVPVKPYLISSITTPFGLTTQSGHTNTGDRLLKASTAQKLKQYMRYNVSSYYGDGLFPNLAVCAKTGTAEVGGGKKPNGWMVGFSANENTPLAFAVVVENTKSGISSAGQIASALMTAAAKTLK